MSRGAATRRYLTVAERQPVLAILATDWRHRPPAVKRYPPGAAVPLPQPPPATRADPQAPPSLDLLSRLLADSYGLIRYRWDSVGILPGQRGMLAQGRPHRPVASAGGLYPSELYLVTGDGWGGGRPAAVLHYDPAAHALDPVRGGGAGLDPGAFRVVITSVFARTAFKYQEFGFRLQCLDAGVLAGQVLTGLEEAGLAGRVRLGFDDAAVAALLGVEADREAPLVLIDVGGAGTAPAETSTLDATRQPSTRTRPAAVLDSVPLTRDLHRSARATVDPVWPAPVAGTYPPLPAPVRRVPLPDRRPPALSPGIPRRRSLDGRFGTAPLAVDDLAAILETAYRWPARPAGLEHLVPLCAVHRVAGLEPGVYRYEPATHGLLLLRPADLRAAMAPPDPGSARYLGDHGAGAVLVPLGDYERGLAAAGDRWFQMQNVPAGITVQRATLVGAALGLDCRVVCSFDVDHLAGVLGLSGGPLRPLCQILIGSTGTDVGYDQPL
jgi:SagB-type dehydrogenase family enzyme